MSARRRTPDEERAYRGQRLAMAEYRAVVETSGTVGWERLLLSRRCDLVERLRARRMAGYPRQGRVDPDLALFDWPAA